MRASGEDLNILVVDDDEVDRMAVRRALRAAGVEASVQEAGDVAAALDALHETAFDCAFLDYQLPGGDGLRVLREARQGGVDTPIIMLTGQEDARTAVELMKAGASDYLSKGALTPERLERSLRSALRVHQAEVQARRAQEALRESEARFRVLHETSPDAFIILSSVRGGDGAIRDFQWVYANPAAERIAGRTMGELEGKFLLQENPGVLSEGLFDRYVQVVESGEPDQLEVHYTHEGLDVWLRITAVRLHDGVAVGYSDISRRKRAEEERERAVAMRARFYAAMSHELRTPINAILGYNDLLLAGVYGTLNEKQNDGLERGQRAARHLLDLVNDVLDLSKLEAGKMPVYLEEVSIGHMIRELLEAVEPLAREKGIELDVETEGELPELFTDRTKLKQILLNLLSNAIKFTAEGGVLMRAGRTEEERIQISVRDTGIGIKDEDQETIFDDFRQVDQSPTREYGGTGLGLSITRKLVALLDGTIWVDSRYGEGSTFYMELPQRLDPGSPEEQLKRALASSKTPAEEDAPPSPAGD